MWFNEQSLPKSYALHLSYSMPGTRCVCLMLLVRRKRGHPVLVWTIFLFRKTDNFYNVFPLFVYF